MLPVLDLYPFGSTSPIYVTVGGAPLRSSEDARFLLAWTGRLAQVARASTAWNTPAERDSVLSHIERARRVYAAQSGVSDASRR